METAPTPPESRRTHSAALCRADLARPPVPTPRAPTPPSKSKFAAPLAPTAADCIIITLAAIHHRVHPSELTRPGRRPHVAAARQLAMVLLRRHTPHTLTHIAHLLGLGSHHTITHGAHRAHRTQPASIAYLNSILSPPTK